MTEPASFNYLGLLPVMIIGITAFIVLFMDMSDKLKPRLMSGCAITGFLLAALANLPIWLQGSPNSPLSYWGGIYVADGLSVVFSIVACLTGALVLVFSTDYLVERKEYPREFISLACFVVLGLVVACSTKELLTFLIAFEVMSLPLYAMAAWGRFKKSCAEAGYKYFLNGAIATAFMLYGISLIFGTTGTTFFDLLPAAYNTVAAPRHAFVLGGLLLLCGLCFKIAAAPFHMWAPDVYQGSPTPAGMFISTAPKATIIAFLLRLFWGPLSQQGLDFRLADVWIILFAAIAILSMFWGNLVALCQTDIKRLMAYSGIAQIGYTLLGVMAASRLSTGQTAAAAAIFYIVMYSFANLAAWSVILIYSWQRNNDEISAYKGLAKLNPFLAFTLLIALLSMAGAPPLAGFIGKLYLFRGVLEAQPNAAWWWVALLGILNSVISLYYYFGVLKPVYFDDPEDFTPLRVPTLAKVGMLSCLLVITVLALCPDITSIALQAGANIRMLAPIP